MKLFIGALALAFCINAAATLNSAEDAWKICAPVVKKEAQSRLDDLVQQANNPTLTGQLGSTYDIKMVGPTVQSTTFYTLTWIVAAEGEPRNYSYGEFIIKAEANGSDCKIQ